jgi:hypothetical protein
VVPSDLHRPRLVSEGQDGPGEAEKMDPVPMAGRPKTGTGVKSRVNSVPEFVLHGKWYGRCNYIFLPESLRTPGCLASKKLLRGERVSKWPSICC